METANAGFIEILRNRSVAYRMGVTNLSGLVGNVTIPKLTAAATNYWLSSESTQITESQQTLGQLSMTPKTAIAITDVSEQLLRQATPLASAANRPYTQVFRVRPDSAAFDACTPGLLPSFSEWTLPQILGGLLLALVVLNCLLASSLALTTHLTQTT